MRSDHGRAERLRHVIQQALSDILLRKVKDPRVHSVTVTDVRVTPDLRHADVFIAMGRRSSEEEEEALQGVRSATGYLRSELGAELELRYVPELHVELDRSFDEAQRIEALIARARKADGEAGD